jgi:hypothetical protein
VRPGGKRSKTQPESIILGQVHRATSLTRVTAEQPRGDPENQPPLLGNGRPRLAAADALVVYLAIDWLHATGHEAPPGRGDGTGFGALAHDVFGWLGIDRVEQSLQRCRDEGRYAEIAPTDGGLVFR